MRGRLTGSLQSGPACPIGPGGASYHPGNASPGPPEPAPSLRDHAEPTSSDRRPGEHPGPVAGWHPLLFAAYPVLFLWSQNLADVPLGHALQPLVLIVLGAAIATLALAAVIGDRARAALIVTPIVLGLLMYGHVVDLIAAPGLVHRLGWVALIGLGALGAWRLGAARLLSIDRALLAVSAVLVVFTLVSIVPHEIETATAAAPPNPAAGRELATATTAQKRDVYWLVFDRYPSDRAIQLQFGIKNDLTPWLADHGFKVLGDSHANYIATSLSISTTANLTTLDDLTAGTTSPTSIRERTYDSLQDPLVAQQFKALGYRYLHMGSWWNPTRDRQRGRGQLQRLGRVGLQLGPAPGERGPARPQGPRDQRADVLKAVPERALRARHPRQAARRARPEVRLRPRPPAPSGVRLRQRRQLHSGREVAGAR